MPQTKALSLTLSVIALTAASPALAITAEELWAEWQTQSGAMGQVMAAETVTPGAGSLTLTGLTTTFSDGEVTTVGRIDQIVMTDNADGSVSIDMSDIYALNISFVDVASAPPVNINVNLIAPELVITASGEPGSISYAYSAPRIMIEDGPITGGDGAPPTIDMNIAIEGFEATYQLDGTDPANMSYISSSSFAGLSGAADILPPPGEAGHMKLSFALGASVGGGQGSLGNFPAVAANPAMTPAGFDLTATLQYASARLELTFEHPTDGFNLFASNRGGSFSATFSDAQFDYRITAQGSATHFAAPDMPVPVDVSVGSAELALAFPLAPGAGPQPMSARIAYQDLMVGPQIWAMADPGGAIPRDPITMIADLSGTVQVLTNLLAMDPNAMGAPPAELRDLTLNELRISAAGASLTGSGSATFTPGPIPMPVGSVDLQLTGGMGLMDRLQAAGLVPVEQLALVRGLLGAYARPGAAPDTLETNVTFAEGGAVTLNGVPFPPM